LDTHKPLRGLKTLFNTLKKSIDTLKTKLLASGSGAGSVWSFRSSGGENFHAACVAKLLYGEVLSTRDQKSGEGDFEDERQTQQCIGESLGESQLQDSYVSDRTSSGGSGKKLHF
jgi:hypothetical protein